MKSGLLFDIKHYAIHDGPGIRTTLFFKGCPLNCWWCHNPEGISPKPELMFKSSRCLPECSLCVQSCPNNALAKNNGLLHIETSQCRLVGECAKICPTLALEKIGYKLTVAEAMAVIEKDRIFQETSQGGVTFSGGEPLMQPEFLEALLDTCQQRGIHTILDTSGHAPYEILERIRKKVDLFFYDLKLMDENKHREVTGISNRLILDNLNKLAHTGSKIQIRIPLIPEVNTTQEEIAAMAEFITSLPGIEEISLLPYHKMGGQKYKNLNRPLSHPQAQVPSEEDIRGIQSQLEPYGFGIKIGG
ncbi:MAG: glycyl-radical enzyme activating protein [Candidatus Aminicenantes bacterium]|nr:glycyl-radical enzyme activating protein [Candidatus Aminicenantes bacterium]